MTTRIFALLNRHRHLDDAIRAERMMRWPDVVRIDELRKAKLAVRNKLHALTVRAPLYAM